MSYNNQEKVTLSLPEETNSKLENTCPLNSA